MKPRVCWSTLVISALESKGKRIRSSRSLLAISNLEIAWATDSISNKRKKQHRRWRLRGKEKKMSLCFKANEAGASDL